MVSLMGTFETASGTAPCLLFQNLQGVWGCSMLQMLALILSQKASISSCNTYFDPLQIAVDDGSQWAPSSRGKLG